MMTRRAWIGGALAAAVGLGSAPTAPDDPWVKVRERARAARLTALAGVESDHFQSLGDAALDYQKEALALAESFAADAFTHFRSKGFAVDWPSGKLPVVILASETSYIAFHAVEQQDFNHAEGGSFDIDNNWLVTFDFRPRRGAARGLGGNNPEVVNTFTLVHELSHQWCYNTGLLARTADNPLALIEGLGTYAETWRPRQKGAIGLPNRLRQDGLQAGKREGVGWINVSRLLAEDALFDDPKTEQVAYAIAAALTHRLLKDPKRLEQFRAYLLAVRTNTDPARRLALLTEHFGDLDKLNAEVRSRSPR